MGVGLEGLALPPLPEPREVEDLHATATRLAHDEGVVVVDLDVAPRAGRCLLGHLAHDDRLARLRDVDEGRAVLEPDERVLLPRGGVGPAPDVVCVRARAQVEVRERDEGGQVDAVAGVARGIAVGALCQGATLRGTDGVQVHGLDPLEHGLAAVGGHGDVVVCHWPLPAPIVTVHPVHLQRGVDAGQRLLRLRALLEQGAGPGRA
mmetsp:Transcript_109922/g.311017  ORF Transcript_109922/g.311017 Transcript_109922/m.311017 type:complete len:206 (-) Transcript_109922:195-812(-)